MRERPELALLASLAVGLVVLALVGLTRSNDNAFTLGVVPGGVAAELERGDRACQERIDAPEDFSEIELQIGTYRRAGAPLMVTVHESEGRGRLLGRGELAGGYPDVSRQLIPVGKIEGGRQVAICVETAGGRRTALYGNAGRAAPASTLEIDGKLVDGDLTLVFHTSEQRSLIAKLPDILERAALFKGGWVGAWVFWLLLAGVLLVVPVALVYAIRALRPEGSPPRGGARAPEAPSAVPAPPAEQHVPR
jgi:hypothetical protein